MSPEDLDWKWGTAVHRSLCSIVSGILLLPQLALLCGPPGLGKTTLAHIIAQHAGYHVTEMNARLVDIRTYNTYVCIWVHVYMHPVQSLFFPFHLLSSDDRSAEIFQQRLEAATQMQAVLTPDCRPTCLIIDEIDGAPSVSTQVHMCKKGELCVCMYVCVSTYICTCTHCVCIYYHVFLIGCYQCSAWLGEEKGHR